MVCRRLPPCWSIRNCSDGAISGAGGIAKTGNSTLVLSDANPFTGNTLIAGGAVDLSSSAALENSTVVIDVPNGLQFSTGTASVGGLSGSSALTLSNTSGGPVVVTVGGNNANTTYSGSINGNGTLVKAGSGSFDLTGTSKWTGGFILDPGTVVVSSDAALGSPTGTATWNGVIANIILTANSGFQADGSFTLSASRSIAINSTANATFNAQGNTLTIGSAISGGGGLAVSGSGTLVLCGSNTYTGPTTVADGTLKLDFSQPGAAANIVNNLADSSSLTLSGGTLAIQGNANATNSQQFNGLTVTPGASAIVLTASSSNPLVLSLGSISRGVGGTLDFTLPGGTQSAANGISTTTPNTNGILGG